MPKTRSFVVTQWNLECDYQALVDSGQVQYIAYGLEECPTTKRKHHQTFLYFVNQKSDGAKNLCKIGKMFGKVQCNVQPMRGSLAQNEAYCSKESELTTFGVKPSPGARGDIQAVVNQIVAGERTAEDVALNDAAFFHQYGRTLQYVEAVALRRQWRTWMTKGIWYHGPPACGKSHKAFDGYDPTTHYIKNLNEEWWDGYKGQEIVILNEFRGQIPFSELLDLVDKWPKTVKWRGRESVPFLAKTVIVASVHYPMDVYKRQTAEEPWEQFSRRFDVIELEAR